MSWRQLLAIAADSAVPRSPGRECPNDATVLRSSPDGTFLWCPFDGWRGTQAQAVPSGPVKPVSTTGYGLSRYGIDGYGA